LKKQGYFGDIFHLDSKKKVYAFILGRTGEGVAES